MTSFTVHCIHCDSGFPVDPDKVPDGGVRARCTNCEGIFFVSLPEEMPVPDVVVSEAAAEPEVPGPEVTERETREQDTTGPELEEPTVPDVEVAVPEAAGTEVPDTFHVDSDDEISTELETEPEAVPADEEPAEDEEDGDLQVDDQVDDAGFGSFDDEVDAVDTIAADSTSRAETGVEEEIAAVPTGFQFGQRDPHDKARRLARVLVSDMITYNPDRHAQALARGTLADDFEDEIAKSWEEYVDQVGREMAESTDYWTNALNDVLARGEKVF